MQRITTIRRLGLAFSALALACSCALAQTTPTVQPGDDFYEFVNGAWLARTEIPADQSSWGPFSAVGKQMEADIVKLIEQLPAGAAGDAHKAQAYFRAYLDVATINARGIAPLRPQLDAIAAIADRAGLARALGAGLRADVDPLNATNFHTRNLFGLWIAPGMDDPKHNRPYLLQGGLTLPSRGLYVGTSARAAETRAKFETYITEMLRLAGHADPAASAARVMALELKIAKAHASEEDSNDLEKSSKSWKAADFNAQAPGLDWPAFFAAARLKDAKLFGVWQPEATQKLAALVGEVDLVSWKDYLAFHAIDAAGPVLPEAFRTLQFELYGKTLRGTTEPPPRQRQAFGAVSNDLPDAVGQIYVGTYFPADRKLRLQQIVDNIKAAFGRRIDKLEWMAPTTRAQAKEKLKTLYVGIGYPDRWTSYAALQVSADDAYGNRRRASLLHYEQQLAKLRAPVDRTEWAMAAQTVDAINLPLQNALNFPAGILQPPMFDASAGDAAIYGSIGAVIGHEISHSFDNSGALIDARGALRNWWTKADFEQFQKASAALVAQYSAYKPLPDAAVNGELTLGENLSDLAGLAAAYDAFRMTLEGKPASFDSAKADRDFFTSYATIWCGKIRDSSLRLQLATDGHAPAKYRVMTVRNLDAWYRAFDVKPGQAMYLKPEERVRVW